MKFIYKFYVLLVTITLSMAVSAQVREIKSIGCHLNDGTCFVNILGDPIGPESCKSDSIRWDKDSSNSGKEVLSLLMAATAAKQKVLFNIVDTCYGDYPTFNYIIVYAN